MSVLNRNPQNTNPLQASKFLLTFSRIPDTQYFCQQVNLPGFSLGEVPRGTPFLDMYSPGTKLSYDKLDVTFIVDEQMLSWRNLYDWFISIADPDGFEKRNHVREIGYQKHLSDASLTILSGLNNPVMRIEFANLFPTEMQSIQFDTQSDANQIITCTVSFRYQSYKYLTI